MKRHPPKQASRPGEGDRLGKLHAYPGPPTTRKPQSGGQSPPLRTRPEPSLGTGCCLSWLCGVRPPGPETNVCCIIVLLEAGSYPFPGGHTHVRSPCRVPLSLPAFVLCVFPFHVESEGEDVSAWVGVLGSGTCLLSEAPPAVLSR